MVTATLYSSVITINVVCQVLSVIIELTITLMDSKLMFVRLIQSSKVSSFLQLK